MDVALVKRLGPIALLGSVLGASLILGFKNAELFRILVAVLVVGVGLLVLTNRKMGFENRYAGLSPRVWWIGGLGVLVIGVYDGFFGPGTGTFLMFLFVSFLRFDFIMGTGNAKVMNFMTNLGAFLTLVFTGNMLFLLGIPMGIANALGAWVGARAAILKGSAFIKIIYAFIIVLVVLRLVFLK